MDTLSDLINKLWKNKHRPSKLAIVLGDGYDPASDIMPPSQICKTSGIGRACDIKKTADHLAIWRVYEKARFRTSNQYPDPLLFYITRLSSAGIVSAVVTTNYDSYWRSIKLRGAYPVAINPVPGLRARDKYYDNPNGAALPIFIIHGQFDYARHQECDHRKQLRSYINRPFSRYSNIAVCKTCNKKVLRHHDIDWMNANNRDYYIAEIDYGGPVNRCAKSI